MTRLEYLQAVKKLLPANPVCAEIGVYRGDFSKMILEELEPKGLLLVDVWSESDDKYDCELKVRYSNNDDYKFVLSRFRNTKAVYSIGIGRMSSEHAVNHFKEYLLDFIYIDADHRYESVKQDLEMWYKLLSENGCIGGHDYGNEVFTGVKKAVDEFCEESNLKIMLLSYEGDFALK